MRKKRALPLLFIVLFCFLIVGSLCIMLSSHKISSPSPNTSPTRAFAPPTKTVPTIAIATASDMLVSYLQDGDVWIAGDTAKQFQLTKTNGGVGEYVYNPKTKEIYYITKINNNGHFGSANQPRGDVDSPNIYRCKNLQMTCTPDIIFTETNPDMKVQSFFLSPDDTHLSIFVSAESGSNNYSHNVRILDLTTQNITSVFTKDDMEDHNAPVDTPDQLKMVSYNRDTNGWLDATHILLYDEPQFLQHLMPNTFDAVDLNAIPYDIASLVNKQLLPGELVGGTVAKIVNAELTSSLNATPWLMNDNLILVLLENGGSQQNAKAKITYLPQSILSEALLNNDTGLLTDTKNASLDVNNTIDTNDQAAYFLVNNQPVVSICSDTNCSLKVFTSSANVIDFSKVIGLHKETLVANIQKTISYGESPPCMKGQLCSNLIMLRTKTVHEQLIKTEFQLQNDYTLIQLALMSDDPMHDPTRKAYVLYDDTTKTYFADYGRYKNYLATLEPSDPQIDLLY